MWLWSTVISALPYSSGNSNDPQMWRPIAHTHGKSETSMTFEISQSAAMRDGLEEILNVGLQKSFRAISALLRLKSGRQSETTGFPTPKRSSVPIKIMIIGDSISHGHQGDWTWRYRIWEWFKKEKIAVDFVGPYTGTAPLFLPETVPPVEGIDNPPATSGEYASGISTEFDSDHFAAWGFQAAQYKGMINYQVQKLKPDYAIILLGFNDLAWGASDAEGLIENMRILIENTRRAHPNIKVVVGNVVQRLFIPGREDLPIMTDQYNLLIETAVLDWSTSKSPVALARVRQNYDCDIQTCPAGHDGLHPNSFGEFQIAQEFSRTLVERFKLGQRILEVPATFNLSAKPLSVGALLSFHG